MTLHIDITINGTTVLHVAVVNEGPCSDGVHHRYRWVAEPRTAAPGPHGHLLHDRDAGAAALAAAVLHRLERHPPTTETP